MKYAHDDRFMSRRYAAIHSYLEMRLMAALLAGTIKTGSARYWKYNELIELANTISCQYDELYNMNT